jgi:hypothetical protein
MEPPRKRAKGVVIMGFGQTGTQDASLSAAIGELTDQASIEIVYRDKFHKEDEEMYLDDIVDCALSKDFHIIATHIPEGQPPKMKKIWDLRTYPEELARLRDHVGYPFGSAWNREGDQDPTFQQVRRGFCC